MDVPLKLFSIGMVIKIIVNYILVGIPEINIQGANMGSMVCYSFVTIVALFVLCRQTKIVPDFVSIFVKPLIASVICGAAAYFSEILFDIFFPQKIATILAIVAAIVVYATVLLLIRAISRDDLMQMPKGNKIVKVLEKHNLIR